MTCFFFFSSRRRHTRFSRDWSSDVCSSDLRLQREDAQQRDVLAHERAEEPVERHAALAGAQVVDRDVERGLRVVRTGQRVELVGIRDGRAGEPLRERAQVGAHTLRAGADMRRGTRVADAFEAGVRPDRDEEPVRLGLGSEREPPPRVLLRHDDRDDVDRGDPHGGERYNGWTKGSERDYPPRPSVGRGSAAEGDDMRGRLGAILTIALIAVACGGSTAPVASPTSTAAGTAGATQAAAAPKTTAELATYQGADRQKILEEGAKKEGKLVWYTSLAGAAIDRHAAAFKAKYPFLQVDIFRGTESELLTKATQELQAGQPSFDVIESQITAIQLLFAGGHMSPYYSPSTKAIPDDFKTKDKGELVQSATDRFSLISFAYNTNLIAKGEVAASPTIFKDHADLAALEKKAPVKWVPLEPVVGNTGQAAMALKGKSPNAALLFLDYLLGADGQKVYRENQYAVAGDKLDFKVWVPESGKTTDQIEKDTKLWSETFKATFR